MGDELNLDNRIVAEFVAGLTLDNSTSISTITEDDNLEVELAPEVAAAFEVGLESQISLSCGCGCDNGDNSCSSGAEPGCRGCHHG
ncbi:hypothetical protein KAI46_16725 [bacterium]|nr:hypothetical protein [bacterium]